MFDVIRRYNKRHKMIDDTRIIDIYESVLSNLDEGYQIVTTNEEITQINVHKDLVKHGYTNYLNIISRLRDVGLDTDFAESSIYLYLSLLHTSQRKFLEIFKWYKPVEFVAINYSEEK